MNHVVISILWHLVFLPTGVLVVRMSGPCRGLVMTECFAGENIPEKGSISTGSSGRLCSHSTYESCQNGTK